MVDPSTTASGAGDAPVVNARPSSWLGFRMFSPWAVLFSFGALGLLLLFANSIGQDRPVLARRLLAEFPDEVGAYQKTQELGLDNRTLNVLKPTDFTFRYYQRSPTEPPVSFYIAYHESQDEGSRVHSPKSCLPGGGWRIASLDKVTLPWKGRQSTANLVLVEQGMNKQLALYWIHSNGRIMANEYIARLYMFKDVFTKRRSDGALVRLMTAIDRLESKESAKERLLALAIPSLDVLHEYLPE